MWLVASLALSTPPASLPLGGPPGPGTLPRCRPVLTARYPQLRPRASSCGKGENTMSPDTASEVGQSEKRCQDFLSLTLLRRHVYSVLGGWQILTMKTSATEALSRANLEHPGSRPRSCQLCRGLRAQSQAKCRPSERRGSRADPTLPPTSHMSTHPPTHPLTFIHPFPWPLSISLPSFSSSIHLYPSF